MYEHTIEISITILPDALIARGELPVDLFVACANYAEKFGWHKLDIGMAQVLGATLVATNAEGSARLRAEYDARLKNLPPLLRWLKGYDTGVSSKTMAHAIFGAPLDRSGNDTPHDSDDFGRCVRFLDAVPGAREGLPKVAETYPEWAPLIREWDALEALYRNEVPTVSCPHTMLYARLQELRAEGDGGRP